MKALKITKCNDAMKWYADLIGQTVPLVGDTGLEYVSREPEGYINYVDHEDAEVYDDES